MNIVTVVCQLPRQLITLVIHYFLTSNAGHLNTFPELAIGRGIYFYEYRPIHGPPSASQGWYAHGGRFPGCFADPYVSRFYK